MHERSLSTPALRTEQPLQDLLVTPGAVIAQHDDAARLYDPGSGQLLRRLDTGPTGHTRRTLALHPDGKTVLVVTSSGLHRFDLGSGERSTFVPLNTARGVAVSPDGTVAFVAAREAGHVVALFRVGLDDGAVTPVARFGPYRGVSGLALDAAGTSLWLSLSTELCRVEVATGDTWTSAADRDGRIAGVVPLEASRQVVTGTFDARLQLWRPDAPRPVDEVQLGPGSGAHEVPVTALRGGAFFAAADPGQRLLLFAPGENQPRCAVRGPRAAVTVLASGPDGTLWAGATDGTVWRLEVADEVLVRDQKGSTKRPAHRGGAREPALTAHSRAVVTALAVLDDDRAVSADAKGAVLGWQRGTQDAVAARVGKPDRSGRSAHAILAIGAAAGAVVVRESGGGFLALDRMTLEKQAKLSHRGATRAVGVGAEVVVTAGGKTLQAFRPGTWEQLAESVGPGGQVEQLEAVPARAAVVASDGQTVGLFSAAELRSLGRRSFADVERVHEVHPDLRGERVALFITGKDGRTRIRLWSPGAADTVTFDADPRGMAPVEGGVVAVVAGALTLFDFAGAVVSRHPLAQLLDAPLVRLAAADARRVALAAGGRLSVVDPRSGKLLQRHAIDAAFMQVQFRGEQLVCTTDGGRVLWLAAEMGTGA
jgi:WD40 repeat protein